MKLELPDELLDAIALPLADRIYRQIRDRLEQVSPWMTTAEAIEYSRIPRGTFEKLSADGTIPSHGGKSKVFHRAEVDQALGYHAGDTPPTVRKIRSA